MENTSTFNLVNAKIQYPSLLKRVQALAIDFLLILIIFASSSLIINTLGNTATEVKVGIFIFCVVLYEPMMVAFMGGTIGHKVLKMKVKSYDNPDRNISIFSALLRIVVKAALGWISFLTVSFNSEKRAIHDMMSGSVVMMKD